MGITRRAAIAAVSLLSAVSLAACGGSASNSSTGAASGAASASGSGAPQKATGELKVLAAASLKASFTEIGTQLEKDNPGLHVTFDFQGSQTLVSSLSEGNEADILATADEPTMNKAVEQKLVGERTEFATNVPTLIVPKGLRGYRPVRPCRQGAGQGLQRHSQPGLRGAEGDGRAYQGRVR